MPKTTIVSPNRRARRWLRKRGVADRYSVDIRTVDRMADDGRIPPPEYLPGSRLPMWAEDKLDANDRRATALPHVK
jgi:hypothetical protein